MNKGYIFVLVTAFLFGTMETALKFFGNMFHPIQITFLRFLIGGLVLMPMAFSALKKKNVKLNGQDLKFFLFSGFLGVVVSMILYQMAIVYGKASVNGVIFSCNPVFVVLFAYFLLGEPIDKLTIFSLMASFAGIICIVDPANMTGSQLSVILILLSAMTFALYGIAGRKHAQRYGGIAMTSLSFVCGSLEMLVLIGLSTLAPVRSLMLDTGLKVFTDIPILGGLTVAHIPPLAYIAVGVTGLGYASYFLTMEYTDPATASLAFYIKPILTAFMAWLVIDEPITVNMVVGIALILFGSCLSIISKRKKAS